MNNLDFVMMMVGEARKSHQSSHHVLCVYDDYGRYIMRAEWNGVPTVCILYDDVNRGLEIYDEAKEISRREIYRLLEVWREIENSFISEEG